MGAIQVRNVPDELHQQLRERARELGISVSELLLTLITRRWRPRAGRSGTRASTNGGQSPTPRGQKLYVRTERPAMTKSPAPVVVDASALLEVLFGGSSAAATRQAIGDSEMCAPDLIFAETLQTIRRISSDKGISVTRADEAVDDLVRAPIRIWETRFLAPRVWELRDDFTSYDACHVALAEFFGPTLITAHAKLARSPRASVPTILV